MLKILEEFISVNGEGLNAGERAYFIRLSGCNLSCSWCDTEWSQLEGDYESKSVSEVVSNVLQSGVQWVTLTGGEPLRHAEAIDLINALTLNHLKVEIETNGSIELMSIRKQLNCPDRVRFTIDYKLQSSGMNEHMIDDNYKTFGKLDCVKLVIGSREDLSNAVVFINKTQVHTKVPVLLSPCFGTIEPISIAEIILNEKWNNVRIQKQLHKWIWHPEQRGV